MAQPNSIHLKVSLSWSLFLKRPLDGLNLSKRVDKFSHLLGLAPPQSPPLPRPYSWLLVPLFLPSHAHSRTHTNWHTHTEGRLGFPGAVKNLLSLWASWCCARCLRLCVYVCVYTACVCVCVSVCVRVAFSFTRLTSWWTTRPGVFQPQCTCVSCVCVSSECVCFVFLWCVRENCTHLLDRRLLSFTQLFVLWSRRRVLPRDKSSSTRKIYRFHRQVRYHRRRPLLLPLSSALAFLSYHLLSSRIWKRNVGFVLERCCHRLNLSRFHYNRLDCQKCSSDIGDSQFE